MVNTDAFAIHRSDLNRFLFADVGVEANGMALTVLSTLARFDKDPWEEAGRLAKQPRKAAIAALAQMIVAMPGSLWPLPDATAIAARLVNLLPARGSGTSLSRLARMTEPSPPGQRRVGTLPVDGPSSATPPQITRPSAIVLAMLAALLAGLTLDLAGQHSAAEHAKTGLRTSTAPALEAGASAYGEPGQGIGQ